MKSTKPVAFRPLLLLLLVLINMNMLIVAFLSHGRAMLPAAITFVILLLLAIRDACSSQHLLSKYPLIGHIYHLYRYLHRRRQKNQQCQDDKYNADDQGLKAAHPVSTTLN